MSILVNGVAIESFNFPAGETHVRLSGVETPRSTSIDIEANLINSDTVMQLLLTVDGIRRMRPSVEINLTIPYFPYSRQDRVCNFGEALSVRVMADLINSLNCQQVTIVDPHSDVTPALLNNCRVITQADVIIGSQLYDRIVKENWALISPDAGAIKKIHQLGRMLSSQDFQPDIFYGDKIRDTQTGRIVSTQFTGDVAGRKVLIVDDICDGGRTFIELAKKLQEYKAKSIYLYVTHGIFSKGLDILQAYFDQIYCYHVFPNYVEPTDDFLRILKTTDNNSFNAISNYIG